MKPATAPVPAKLRRLLTPRGIRARIVLTDSNGEPVSAEEAREVRELVAMLDVVDARVAKALAVVARAIPASLLPFPLVLPGALREPAPKRTAGKARAKPARRRSDGR